MSAFWEYHPPPHEYNTYYRFISDPFYSKPKLRFYKSMNMIKPETFVKGYIKNYNCIKS